jgi:hypothetical protein
MSTISSNGQIEAQLAAIQLSTAVTASNSSASNPSPGQFVEVLTANATGDSLTIDTLNYPAHQWFAFSSIFSVDLSVQESWDGSTWVSITSVYSENGSLFSTGGYASIGQPDAQYIRPSRRFFKIQDDGASFPNDTTIYAADDFSGQVTKAQNELVVNTTSSLASSLTAVNYQLKNSKRAKAVQAGTNYAVGDILEYQENATFNNLGTLQYSYWYNLTTKTGISNSAIPVSSYVWLEAIENAQPVNRLVNSTASFVQVASLAGSRQIKEISFDNLTNTTVYLQIFNQASAPILAAVPLESYRVFGDSALNLEFKAGLTLPLGGYVGFSSTNATFTASAGLKNLVIRGN